MSKHKGGAGVSSPALRSRDHALDALRGIAILSVVLGHLLAHTGISDPPGWIGTVLFTVYVYNVQVFGFVSGYLLKRLSLTHKAVTLLIPLLASIVFNAAVGEGQFLRNIPAQAVAAVNGSGMWFLWALFLGFCLFALLRRQWLLIAAAILIGAVWSFIPVWSGDAPINLTSILGTFRTVGLLFPYMVLGAVWRRYEIRLSALLTTGALIGLATVVYALMTIQATVRPTTLFEARALMIGYWSLQMLGSSLACLGLLGVCRLLRGPVLQLLAFFGVLSLGIYQFHPIFISRFPALFQPQSVVDILPRFAALLLLAIGLTYVVSLNKFTAAAFLGGRIMFPKPWPGFAPWKSLQSVEQSD